MMLRNKLRIKVSLRQRRCRLLVPEGWAPCPRLLPEWYSEAFVHADLFAGGTGERVSLALRVEATRRLAVEGGNERPVVRSFPPLLILCNL